MYPFLSFIHSECKKDSLNSILGPITPGKSASSQSSPPPSIGTAAPKIQVSAQQLEELKQKAIKVFTFLPTLFFFLTLSGLRDVASCEWNEQEERQEAPQHGIGSLCRQEG